jgi:hypothetical protein
MMSIEKGNALIEHYQMIRKLNQIYFNLIVKLTRIRLRASLKPIELSLAQIGPPFVKISKVSL